MARYERWRARYWGAVLLVVLGWAGNAAAQDTITWGYSDSPPNRFANGPYKNQGLQDRIRLFLQQHLRGYAHQDIIAPFPRTVEEIKSGEHWCYLNATKTAERETWAYFSLPAVINLPYRVIVRKEQRAKFERSGGLSLEALLQDRTLRTSRYRSVAYGPALDPMLQKWPPEQQHSDTSQAVKMLLSGRLDYLVDFPLLALYTAKEQGQEGVLVALPFKEGGDPDLTRVMCPKNAWGKQVIEQLDVVLRQERPTAGYRKMMEAWQDEDGVRGVRVLYDGVFLKME